MNKHEWARKIAELIEIAEDAGFTFAVDTENGEFCVNDRAHCGDDAVWFSTAVSVW